MTGIGAKNLASAFYPTKVVTGRKRGGRFLLALLLLLTSRISNQHCFFLSLSPSASAFGGNTLPRKKIALPEVLLFGVRSTTTR